MYTIHEHQNTTVHHVTLLRRAAVQYPDREAIGGDAPRMYRELDRDSDRITMQLRARLDCTAGPRPVGLIAANDYPVVAAMFGIWKAGMIMTFIDPTASDDVARDRLAGLPAAALLLDDGNASRGRW